MRNTRSSATPAQRASSEGYSENAIPAALTAVSECGHATIACAKPRPTASTAAAWRKRGPDLANAPPRRFARDVPLDDESIADEHDARGAGKRGSARGLDRELRADSVRVADRERDRRRLRHAQSGSANSVSIRELSQTTIRSANRGPLASIRHTSR
jgi:hypothetical protein